MAQPTRMKSALNMAAVPAPKWHRMVVKTAIGALIIALAVLGAERWSWDAKVVIGMAVFGASVWSSQIIANTIMAVVNPVAALRRAALGEKPDDERTDGDGGV